jgi:repressor LexA
MGFTESLKKLREEKGWSQAELAKMVGVTQGAIGQYELNVKQPSVTVAGVIAEKLGTTVDAMIKGE